ncbi:MAG: hypothetical protein HFI91_00765 [Lachnospiraceae bacterium]|jgi:hypothetical protein|nr:hypothetical protein [Lachnospiraceae bacterium]
MIFFGVNLNIGYQMKEIGITLLCQSGDAYFFLRCLWNTVLQTVMEWFGQI